MFIYKVQTLCFVLLVVFTTVENNDFRNKLIVHGFLKMTHDKTSNVVDA